MKYFIVLTFILWPQLGLASDVDTYSSRKILMDEAQNSLKSKSLFGVKLGMPINDFISKHASKEITGDIAEIQELLNVSPTDMTESELEKSNARLAKNPYRINIKSRTGQRLFSVLNVNSATHGGVEHLVVRFVENRAHEITAYVSPSAYQSFAEHAFALTHGLGKPDSYYPFPQPAKRTLDSNGIPTYYQPTHHDGVSWRNAEASFWLEQEIEKPREEKYAGFVVKEELFYTLTRIPNTDLR